MKKWSMVFLAAALYLGYFYLVNLYEAILVFYVLPVLPVLFFSSRWFIGGGILAGVSTGVAITVDLILRYGFPFPFPYGGIMWLSIIGYPLIGFAAGLYFKQNREKRIMLNSLKTLYVTATALHKTKTLDEVSHTLTTVLTSELGFLRGMVLLDNGELSLYADNEKIKDLSEFTCVANYGVCHKVMETGEVYVRKDLQKSSCSVSHPGARSQAILPLVVNGVGRGVVIIDSEEEVAFAEGEQMGILKIFADYVSIVLEKTELLEEKEHLALTDDLTGLPNKRYLNQRIEDELSRHRRFGGQFSLLMLDIDDFKKVNDTYGHLVGDSVLISLGKVLTESIRDVDFACRYGGEEFTVILPHSDVRAAEKVGERIRKSFAETEHQTGSETFFLTISIGVAIYPDDGLDRDEVIGVADERLYEAKRSGKNRVVLG